MSTTRFLVLRGCTFAADDTVNFRGYGFFRNGCQKLPGTFVQGSLGAGNHLGLSWYSSERLARLKAMTASSALRERDSMGKTVQSQPAAFDSMALGYDAQFTASALGRVLRPMVWDRFAACFAPGSSLLELGCGTGEDAIHLATSGQRVLATDASPQMVECASRKAEAAGVADRIRFRVVSMESLSATLGTEVFDGVYSNFGAVNCAADLAAVAGALAPRLAPNAPLVWVVMGRFVPWEMGWYLLRGDARRAFRRFQRAGSEWRGLTIRYPTPRECARLLEPHFVVSTARALGAILPPSYAAGWLERSPRMLAWLSRLERTLFEQARCAGLGDHYVLEARRAA